MFFFISKVNAQFGTLWSDSFEGIQNFSELNWFSSSNRWMPFPSPWNAQGTHAITEFHDVPYLNRYSFFILNSTQINQNPDRIFNFHARTGQNVLAVRGKFPRNDEFFLTRMVNLGAQGNRFSFYVKGIRPMGIGTRFDIILVEPTNTPNPVINVISANNELNVPEAINPNANVWVRFEAVIPSVYNNRQVQLGVRILTNDYCMLFDDFAVTTNNNLVASLEEFKSDKFSVNVSNTGGYVLINTKENADDFVNLKIYDIKGNIKTIIKDNISGQIDIRHFSKGVYFIQLVKKNGTVLSSKFVKNK